MTSPRRADAKSCRESSLNGVPLADVTRDAVHPGWRADAEDYFCILESTGADLAVGKGTGVAVGSGVSVGSADGF